MEIITKTYILVEISAEDIKDVQIVTKSSNVIVSTRIYPKNTDIDLIGAITTVKIMLHNKTFNFMKKEPNAKIQGMLVHYDGDLYRFLPAHMVGNANGRLYSIENNKGVCIEYGHTTSDSIKTIFKH